MQKDNELKNLQELDKEFDNACKQVYVEIPVCLEVKALDVVVATMNVDEGNKFEKY